MGDAHQLLHHLCRGGDLGAGDGAIDRLGQPIIGLLRRIGFGNRRRAQIVRQVAIGLTARPPFPQRDALRERGDGARREMRAERRHLGVGDAVRVEDDLLDERARADLVVCKSSKSVADELSNEAHGAKERRDGKGPERVQAHRESGHGGGERDDPGHPIDVGHADDQDGACRRQPERDRDNAAARPRP